MCLLTEQKNGSTFHLPTGQSQRGVYGPAHKRALGAYGRESTTLACLHLPEPLRRKEKAQQGQAHLFYPKNHSIHQ